MTNLYEFEHKTIDGSDAQLADYRGKVVLAVNVASRCGLTPQYKALEKLYRDKKDAGLVVLGFPCNQFGAQEPGTEAEIKKFCTSKYEVTFPLFAKLDVNGDARHPLYAWLTAQDTKPEGAGAVKWNFGKFLLDREGNLVARFNPTVAPNAEPLVAAIDAALG
jgi:glutathione peroxidase